MPVKATDVKLLQEYIEKGWEFHIIDMLHDLKPVEIAELIEALDEESRGKFFVLLDVDTASEVIAELSSESREDIIDGMSDKELARIVQDMDSDDAADLVGDLHAERAERVLAELSPEDSYDIKSLLKYPEDTAGGIMQRELISAQPNATVDEVIAQIRRLHTEINNIHMVYVVDNRRVLVGTVPLVNLILSKPDSTMAQIMDLDPLTVPVDMDQEQVANLFKRYDSVVLPVVDEQGLLLGRITVDDIVDIMEEEATEDMFMLAGAEEDLLSSSVVRNASTRIPWLFVSWVGGVLATFLIREFETTISKVVGLAAFMPIILGMGGNVAAQAVALIVRGIATGASSSSNFRSIVIKQMGVGVLLGAMFGVMLGLIAYLLYPDELRISIVVALAITISMSLASFMGTFLPILFYKFDKDPAVASGPFVTTTMDILGVAAYLGIAGLLLL
ncbi:MAG: magnesium transporter [Pseudomonadota bacterium]|jgi:magnesium transporter|uniref:Magnesium transporter MgtE n=1 Tax=anaerobic digester metagenome TaxID=1263854 RepID=A0A485LZK1_9ZZZZ|nr:magnesium transporter [Pseudomonadota bacterium]HON39183.1 magnesium transporter [Deltaproteobacteria bacterium]HRS55144.1 magnesium transporter [Desulfomonilia bacterium]HPD22200.1 magnesium transporter [Deltaproteobacteria bacterium]HPX18770.1 magnesium transporter [Deltaproteobacteria bacterium]